MKLLPIKALVIFALFLALPAITQAQPEFEEDLQDVPVDGGLSLLVAAGTLYGVRRLRRTKL
jgi:hypothetical protein